LQACGVHEPEQAALKLNLRGHNELSEPTKGTGDHQALAGAGGQLLQDQYSTSLNEFK